MIILLSTQACGQRDVTQLSLPTEEEVEATQEEIPKNKSIFVYVCGAVVNEGVYELPIGARVYEAIQNAGGFSEDAATAFVNQAEVLDDEDKLYIPTVGEMAEIQAQEDGKVDLNTASKEELMTLPGIGEAKANAVIQYRDQHGKFQTIEDVMNISGIKENLFQKIKEYIKV